MPMLPSQQDPSRFDLEQAEIYDTYLVPAIFAAAADVLLTYVEPKSGERVLDVACGTGIVSRHAAARVGSRGTVIGLDHNPAMLAVARQIPPPTGAPIFWHHGNADELPFAGRSFDLALCQHGLQYFEDPVRATAEMRRVLVPSGRLGVNIFGPLSDNLFYQTFDQHVIRRLGTSLFNTSFSFGGEKRLRSVLTEAGCSDVAVVQRNHTVVFPSARVLVEMSLLGMPVALGFDNHSQVELPDLIDVLIEDMAETTAHYSRQGHIIVPVSIFVGRARP